MDETNVEETVAAEEAAAKDFEQVGKGAGKAPAPVVEVDDEFGSNQTYSQCKSTSTPSTSAPPTSRKVSVFDYWTLTYDDLSDPD